MSFEYHEPRSLAKAIELLARYGDQAKLLAGGTDLMVLASRGKITPAHMISLGSVPGLSGIDRDAAGQTIIGGLTTHRVIETSALTGSPYAALPEACRTVGGVPVRNLGTLAGNLCNASPAADTAPVLLVLDATVRLEGTQGGRTIPLDQFLLGPRRTALAPTEIMTAVTLPKLADRTVSVFLKAGRRKAMEISLCAVAVRVSQNADGTAAVAIGLGAVAPRAVRAAKAEALLAGRTLTPELIREAGAIAATECNPISDLRGSAEYRRLLVETLVERGITVCLERLAAPGAGARVS